MRYALAFSARTAEIQHRSPGRQSRRCRQVPRGSAAPPHRGRCQLQREEPPTPGQAAAPTRGGGGGRRRSGPRHTPLGAGRGEYLTPAAPSSGGAERGLRALPAPSSRPALPPKGRSPRKVRARLPPRPPPAPGAAHLRAAPSGSTCRGARGPGAPGRAAHL